MLGSRQQLGIMILFLLLYLAYSAGRISAKQEERHKSNPSLPQSSWTTSTERPMVPKQSTNHEEVEGEVKALVDTFKPDFASSLPQTVFVSTGMKNNSWFLLEAVFYDSFQITLSNELHEVLHRFTASLAEKTLLQEDYVEGSWGTRQYIPVFPFRYRHKFSLRLLAHDSQFLVFVDKKLVAKWTPRRPYEEVALFVIDNMCFMTDGTEVHIEKAIDIISIKKGNLPAQRNPAAEALSRISTMLGPKLEDLNQSKPMILFIAVVSSPANFMSRQAIRNSWMTNPLILSGKAAARFFVGQSGQKQHNYNLLRVEAARFNDLIILDYPETELGSPNRTLAVSKHITSTVSANYLLKCDDNTFVYLERLLQILDERPPNTSTYLGMILNNVQASRDPLDRWYVPFREYRRDIFPVFAQSNYVLSMDLVKFITTENLPSCRFEDVSVGIWIETAQQRGLLVNIITESRFYSGGCHIDSILGHNLEPSQMTCMWKKLSEGDPFWCC